MTPRILTVLTIVAWAATVAVTAVTLVLGRPPAPAGRDAPPERFSAARAMRHVEEIASEPHPAGSPAEARVRGQLLREFAALGLEARTQEFTARVAGRPETLVNLAARRRGTAPTGTALFVAHYDSKPGAPGAGDDAAAVAALLEALRATKDDPPPRNDVVVLLTDGEEAGLLGSKAFVADHPWMEGVRAVVNFEARGSAGPALMFETGPGSAALVRAYARVAPRPRSNSLMAAVYRRMPHDTDLSTFIRRGLPGLNLALLEQAYTYHAPSDTPENLDRASVQHHGETALALLRVLADADLAAAGGGEVVWFSTAVGVVVHPQGWVLPLAIAAALLGLVALVTRAHRGRPSLRAVGTGALLVLGAVALAALAGQALSSLGLLLRGGRGHAHLAATSADRWFHASAAAAVLAAVAGAWSLAARIGARAAAEAGAAAAALLLAAATAVAFPEGTFAFLWPAAGAGLAIAVRSARIPLPVRAIAVALGAAAVPAVLATLLEDLFHAMTLANAWLASAFLAQAGSLSFAAGGGASPRPRAALLLASASLLLFCAGLL